MNQQDLETQLERIHEAILCLSTEEQKDMTHVLNNILTDLPSQSVVECSKEAIEQFVQQLLKDEDINIGLLPDCIEQKIYTNVIKLIVSILDKLLASCQVSLLNHKITFDISVDKKKISEDK